MAAPVVLLESRGDFSFSKENPPLNPQEKGYIACLDLEELHTLRNVSAVYMASHESSASRDYTQPRLTIVRRE